jgi:alkyl hydroperoxide reductase subunit AhpF
MTEKLLDENIVNQVREVFEQLDQPVEVLYFGRKTDCEYCDDTLQLAEEVVAISNKLSLKKYDIDEDVELAHEYNVDKVPGLVFAGRDGEQVVDYGVRMAGIPSGHEFSSLIHDLVLVSSRDSGLSQDTRKSLKEIQEPVLLQVFITPT